MFNYYYFVYYTDLLYTLKNCGITLDEYRQGQKEGKELHLMCNCVCIYGKRKKVMKRIDEFLQEQRNGGNEVEVDCIMRSNRSMAAMRCPVLF